MRNRCSGLVVLLLLVGIPFTEVGGGSVTTILHGSWNLCT